MGIIPDLANVTRAHHQDADTVPSWEQRMWLRLRGLGYALDARGGLGRRGGVKKVILDSVAAVSSYAFPIGDRFKLLAARCLDGFHVPDVAGVLRDGAVAREFPHPSDV